MIKPVALVLAILCSILPVRAAFAHSGPAFPIVTDQHSGPYTLSIWTDPDTTDDGSAAGRFWVVVSAATASPPAARVTIAAAPRNKIGRASSVEVTSPGRDGHTFYGAVVMDHEGPFAVDVSVTGPAGETVIRTSVDATYDLRPSPVTAAIYLVPFVLVGSLWMRLLSRRSRLSKATRSGSSPDATYSLPRPSSRQGR